MEVWLTSFESFTCGVNKNFVCHSRFWYRVLAHRILDYKETSLTENKRSRNVYASLDVVRNENICTSKRRCKKIVYNDLVVCEVDLQMR